MKASLAKAQAACCCALALAATTGCAPSGGARSVAIQNGGRKLSVEVWQDGRAVTATNGVWRLKARPFELALSGDLSWASYHATVGDELIRKLAALDRPLVFFVGTSSPADGPRLHVLRGRAESDEAAEVFVANEQFFARQWGASETQARELAMRIRKEFGSDPAIACFGHFPLPNDDSAGNPRYALLDPVVREGERLRGRFRIDSLSEAGRDRPIGEFSRVNLLLFIESPVDREFRRVSWSKLTLEFERDASE